MSMLAPPGSSSNDFLSQMPMSPVGSAAGIVTGPGKDFFLSRLPQTLRNFMTKMPEIVYAKPPAAEIADGSVGGFIPSLATSVLPGPVPGWNRFLGDIKMRSDAGPMTAIHEALHALWARKNLLQNSRMTSETPVMPDMRWYPQGWLRMLKGWGVKDPEGVKDILSAMGNYPKKLQGPEAAVEYAAQNALVGGARREPALMEYLRNVDNPLR